MDLDPFNFSDSLLCVLAQRLVKTLCPYCKEAFVPSKEELEELKNEFGSGWEQYFGQEFLRNPKLYRARSCKYCFQGYKGRIGLHELMINTEQIKHHIKFQKPTEEIRTQAKNDGMLTLKQDGILKVIEGITDIHQIRAVAGKN
jgi:type II secretory ATPase GspE/PulE/Tfp pilus assembly ATPase PilB-like protein